MASFLLTPSGDLDVSTGRLQIVTSLAAVAAQKLTVLFKFFLGEWFLDTRQGVPYFKYIFVKNPDMGVVREVLMAVINTVPEVDSVISADLTYNSSLRSASAIFAIQLTDGAIIQGGPGIAFVVKAQPAS